ncbi:MAG: hypothetical protein ACRC1O_18295 [Ralstonia mannitolilytica]|nr:hypothetical protein G5A69_22570 [Ralstonia mannitolilytica]
MAGQYHCRPFGDALRCMQEGRRIPRKKMRSPFTDLFLRPPSTGLVGMAGQILSSGQMRPWDSFLAHASYRAHLMHEMESIR